jgi:hypothetical protein
MNTSVSSIRSETLGISVTFRRTISKCAHILLSKAQSCGNLLSPCFNILSQRISASWVFVCCDRALSLSRAHKCTNGCIQMASLDAFRFASENRKSSPRDSTSHSSAIWGQLEETEIWKIWLYLLLAPNRMAICTPQKAYPVYPHLRENHTVTEVAGPERKERQTKCPTS